MMIEIEADDGILTEGEDELILSAAEEALRVAEAGEDAGVFVLLTDNEGIHTINAAQRGVDAATDVLSFPAQVSGWADIDPQSGARYLGDIVISLERARVQAKEFGHSTRREAAYLAAHGALHLMGYDHEDEAERAVMRGLEEKALARLGLERDNIKAF